MAHTELREATDREYLMLLADLLDHAPVVPEMLAQGKAYIRISEEDAGSIAERLRAVAARMAESDQDKQRRQQLNGFYDSAHEMLESRLSKLGRADEGNEDANRED